MPAKCFGFSAVPRLVWAFAAIALVARAVIAAITGFTNEDFLITLRHVENLVAGHGLVYNPGERVLGTTAPLYALFLSLVARVGLSPVVLGKAVNILADGALCVALYAWLRDSGYERAGVWSAFFVAVNPVHMRWAVSGMETSLVALAGVLALWLLDRRQVLAAYAVLGVLFLLRWDSLLLTGVITLWLLWQARRRPNGGCVRATFAGLLAFALIVAPWVAYASVFYGSPIPVTARAKMTVYAWRQPGPVPQAGKLVDRLVGNPGYLLCTLLAASGMGAVWRRGTPSSAISTAPTKLDIRDPPLATGLSPTTLRVGVAWLIVYYAAWLLSRVLLFEWYLVPPLPVWEALVAIGANRELGAVARRLPAVARWVPLAMAGPLLVAGVWRTAWLCEANQRVEVVVRRPLGLWLSAHARPGDTVMLEPIGYIGYYSKLRVLDVIGLVSPQVLPFWRDQSTAPMLDIARAYRPDWCVLRPGELARIRTAAAATTRPWEEEYDLVGTWDYRSGAAAGEAVTFHLFRRRIAADLRRR